jgi:glutamine amidotransferase-like uncharacterized protein
MKRFLFVVAALLCVVGAEASPRSRERARCEVLANNRGYYKDVFMNGGVKLTSRRDLPVTRYLGLSLDYFATAEPMTQTDTLLQTNIFCGYDEDINGWLLYPDGEPRYRMVYFNGGSAHSHGRSLTDEGRVNMCRYIAGGGSYLGTCAGMFIASKGVMNDKMEIIKGDGYLHIWPGTTKSTNLRKSRTAMRVEKGSPLLRYYDFGGDMVVDSVYHNGGGHIHYGQNSIVPEGTEPLMRYIFDNTDSVKIDGEVSTWAYKQSGESGRVVVTGSHPEGITTGERMDYMSAMVLYALDGNGEPKLKGELIPGECRAMNKRTEDNSPEYTRIGDRQYHHFKVTIPKGCKRAVITLGGYKGEDKFDLSLCAKRGGMAYHDNTIHQNVSRGCDKELILTNPKAGEWYVSVFCETTVTAVVGKYGTTYEGRTDVLNGVPYSIKVDLE